MLASGRGLVPGRPPAWAAILLWLWFIAGTVEVSASELRVGPVFTDRAPELEVVVEPPAAGAEPVAPRAQDLLLVEDGVPTTRADSVVAFADGGHGLAVLVAVDVSGSMAGRPLVELQRALTRLQNELTERDKLALVSFAGDIRVEAPFGATPEQLRRSIPALRARGNTTELYRALFKSLELLAAPELPARRRVLVISDGKDEGTAYRLDDVIGLARSREVPIDAIGLTRIDPKYLSNLERLSDLTHGVYFRAADASQLETLVRNGLHQLRATPLASFHPQHLRPDGQRHRLGVRLAKSGGWLEAETAFLFPALPAGAPPSPASARPADRSGRTFIALGIAGCFLLLSLGLWLLIRRRRPASGAAVPLPRPVSTNPPGSQLGAGENARTVPAVSSARSPGPGEPAVVSGAPLTAPAPAPAARTQRRDTRLRQEFRSPAPGRPAAMLLAEAEGASGHPWPIEVSPYWIGADADCELCLGNDNFLSGHHAWIGFQDGNLLLYDSRSTNGTFVNDERLADVPFPLGPGDRIRVGHSTLVLRVPRRAEPT
jgi:hypothetical protein